MKTSVLWHQHYWSDLFRQKELVQQIKQRHWGRRVTSKLTQVQQRKKWVLCCAERWSISCINADGKLKWFQGLEQWDLCCWQTELNKCKSKQEQSWRERVLNIHIFEKSSSVLTHCISNIHRICHQYSEKPKRNSEKLWKGNKSASATKLGGPIERKHSKLYLVTWLTSRVWSSKSLFGSRLSQMWFWLDRTATLLHTHREHSTSSTWNTACQHFTQQ